MKLSSLIKCDPALSKLIKYEYLPARQIYYLSTIHRPMAEAMEAYGRARNALLAKYGTSEDGRSYNISAENVASYQSELAELEEQETGVDFPTDKITLCVESIDKAEKGLPAERRLGFSANDWATIQEVIKVVETEE